MYTCLLLCYIYTWLFPHLYKINEMWNKLNEMKLANGAVSPKGYIKVVFVFHFISYAVISYFLLY